MKLPFTTDQFFQVFVDYNSAIWPMQFLLVGAALAAVYVALRGGSRAARVPAVTLAVLWAWSGGVYHLIFFRRINPLAIVFGSLFLLQAAVLVFAAFRNQLTLKFVPSATGWAGAALVTYALLLYPLLGAQFGHQYPMAPTFGAPCPVTIFTLGLLMWSTERVPGLVLAIPLSWSLVGFTAALSLGVPEDFGLLAGALLTLGCLAIRSARRVQAHQHAHPARTRSPSRGSRSRSRT